MDWTYYNSLLTFEMTYRYVFKINPCSKMHLTIQIDISLKLTASVAQGFMLDL